MRLSTPSSVSSSFRQLSDKPHCFDDDDDNEDEDHHKAAVSVKSIMISSPKLPVTSPLSVFSSSGYEENTNEGEVFEDCNRQTSPMDQGSGKESKIGFYSQQGELPTIDMNHHGGLKTCDVDHDDLPKSSDCNSSMERRPSHILQEGVNVIVQSEGQKCEESRLNKSRRESNPATTLSTENELDKDLPALNAALNEFSNLNLSFNLDSSSDEEGTSFRPCRVSRDRSRVLGPILPIPSLRDDFEEKARTPRIETQSSPILEEESSPSFILSQSSLPSPFQATNAVSQELLDTANSCTRRSRASRDNSKKNLGLLLPIPSLRDDLSDEKKSSPRDTTILTTSSKDSNESLPAVSSPSLSNVPNRTRRREELSDALETSEDSSKIRVAQISRNWKKRDSSPIVPLPSPRDCSSDKNDVLPMSPMKSLTSISSLSPMDAKLPIHDDTYQDAYPHEDRNETRSNELTGEKSKTASDEFDQVDICSPVLDEMPVRRRGRESILLPTPLLRKGDESGIVTCDETSRRGAEMTEKVVQSEDAETSHCLDSMPLIKHRDRHVLAAVPEHDAPAIEALQEQLAQLVMENRKQAERLARYNRSYEDRVTPYRNLFEEWRDYKRRWMASEASQNALVEEVQGKFAQALQLSLQKCHNLQEQLQASEERAAALEKQLGTSEQQRNDAS